MQLSWVHQSIRVLRSLLLAVLVVGCAAMDRRVTMPPPGCSPNNDTLLVSGCRIGPVALGMTEAELLKFVGPPARSRAYEDVNGSMYSYDDLELWAKVINGRVSEISIGIVSRVGGLSRYATAEGIRLGSTELEVRAKMGQPSWRIFQGEVPDADMQWWSYCYQDGTLVRLAGGGAGDAGRVRELVVNGCIPRN